MTDYIDRCLDEGLLTPSEYSDLIKAGEENSLTHPETCVHEAGHAVAAYVLGRPIEFICATHYEEEAVNGLGQSVTVESDGVVRYADEPWPEGEAECAAMMFCEMATAMAGGYAQHLYTGIDPEDGMSSGDQALVFGNWLCEYGNIMFSEPPFETPEEPTEEDDERFFEWREEQDAGVLRELWAEVERIIRKNWDLVEGLAAVLIRNPYLDGSEVYDMFERIKARRAASH